jgi:pilus assembly protein TadC
MKIGIISYLYIVFFIIAALVDYLPFLPTIKKTSSLGFNSLQTISSNNIEDSEKMKILLANSLNIFKQSLKMLALIIWVAFSGYVLLLLSVVFKSLSYRVLLSYVITLNGLVLSVVSFFSYFLLKKLYVKIRL